VSTTALWTLRDIRSVHGDTPLNDSLECPALTVETLLIPCSKVLERGLTIEMVGMLRRARAAHEKYEGG
jgi:hypothetical protein